jgi:hypothetical protein
MDRNTIDELKKKIYSHIANMNDEIALQLLEEASEAYASPDQKDILDQLTPAQIERLNEAKIQVEKGEVSSHEDIKAKSREWLMK